MGISDVMLSLYTDLKTSGLLDGIDSVVELGSQTVWVQDPERLKALFTAFGRPLPPPDEFASFINTTGTGVASSRISLASLANRRIATGLLPMALSTSS